RAPQTAVCNLRQKLEIAVCRPDPVAAVESKERVHRFALAIPQTKRTSRGAPFDQVIKNLAPPKTARAGWSWERPPCERRSERLPPLNRAREISFDTSQVGRWITCAATTSPIRTMLIISDRLSAHSKQDHPLERMTGTLTGFAGRRF